MTSSRRFLPSSNSLIPLCKRRFQARDLPHGWLCGHAFPVPARYHEIEVVIHTQEHSHLVIHEESVHSADGTRIGYRRLGSGPGIVFVHGSVATHTDWMPAAKLLASRFTCYTMDRRGRRGSGVGNAAYSIERECEDIEALLDVAGPDAVLAAHSYGAVCALATALRRPLPRLVLYEPPLPLEGPVAGPPLEEYAQAMAAGDPARAMEIGLSEFIRLSPVMVASIRLAPGWQKLIALAPSWARELRVMDARPKTVDDYRQMATPTLLLMGSESREHPMKNTTRALAAVLPDARVSVLEGQGHLGLRAAPQLVARAMLEFLSQ